MKPQPVTSILPARLLDAGDLEQEMPMSEYIVSPFRKPRTPILDARAGELMRCPACGNDNQNRFLVVTTLAGDQLHGAVCAPCEADAIDQRS